VNRKAREAPGAGADGGAAAEAAELDPRMVRNQARQRKR